MDKMTWNVITCFPGNQQFSNLTEKQNFPPFFSYQHLIVQMAY